MTENRNWLVASLAITFNAGISLLLGVAASVAVTGSASAQTPPVCKAAPVCGAGQSLQGQADGSVACKACTTPAKKYQICRVSATYQNLNGYILSLDWPIPSTFQQARQLPARSSFYWLAGQMDIVLSPTNIANYKLTVQGNNCSGSFAQGALWMTVTGKKVETAAQGIFEEAEDKAPAWPATWSPTNQPYYDCIRAGVRFPNFMDYGVWKQNQIVCPFPAFQGQVAPNWGMDKTY